jgi:hypothetical protein
MIILQCKVQKNKKNISTLHGCQEGYSNIGTPRNGCFYNRRLPFIFVSGKENKYVTIDIISLSGRTRTQFFLESGAPSKGKHLLALHDKNYP